MVTRKLPIASMQHSEILRLFGVRGMTACESPRHSNVTGLGEKKTPGGAARRRVRLATEESGYPKRRVRVWVTKPGVPVSNGSGCRSDDPENRSSAMCEF